MFTIHYLLLVACFAIVFIPTSARADQAYAIIAKNTCDQPLTVYIRYRDVKNVWRMANLKKISPGQKYPIALSTNQVYYYHAYTVGYNWDGKDKFYDVGLPRKLGFKKKLVTIDDKREFTHTFGCRKDLGSGDRYRLRAYTNCSEPLLMAIRYKNSNGRSVTKGFWIVDNNGFTLLPLMYDKTHWISVFYKETGRPISKDIASSKNRFKVGKKSYRFVKQKFEGRLFFLRCL